MANMTRLLRYIAHKRSCETTKTCMVNLLCDVAEKEGLTLHASEEDDSAPPVVEKPRMTYGTKKPYSAVRRIWQIIVIQLWKSTVGLFVVIEN